MNKVTYEDILNHSPWYHRIPFDDKKYTPGRFVGPKYWDTLGLPSDLSGKTFLDVGTANGLMAFEAEKRGAERVLGVDIWHDKSDKKGAKMVKNYIDSDVEFREINAYNISSETVGEFDFVLCAGLLYHLSNPYGVIDNVVSISTDKVVIETSLNQYKHLTDGVLVPTSSAPPQPIRMVPNLQAVNKMITTAGGSVIKKYTCNVDDSRGGKDVPRVETGIIKPGSKLYKNKHSDSANRVIDEDKEVEILYQDRESIYIIHWEPRFYGWVKPNSIHIESNDQSNVYSKLLNNVDSAVSSIYQEGPIVTLHKILSTIDKGGERGVIHATV